MKFAVIGLGYFGMTLVRELATSGHEVIAVDTDPAHLKEIQDIATLAAEANGDDFEALSQLGFDSVDTAVIAIGEGFESSLMITAHCQKLGVKNVYTRAINGVQSRLLELMGVTGIIQAENMAAINFANQLTYNNIHRYFQLDDDNAIAQIKIPKSMVGQSLREIEFRKTHRLNVVTILRRTESPNGQERYSPTGIPGPDTAFFENDDVLLYGHQKDLDKFLNVE